MVSKQALNAIIAFLLCLCSSTQVWAQTELQKLTSTIINKDSLFWVAYNKCDTETFQQFFTPDVEFYHDKGGMTIGLEGLTTNMKKNLCGPNDFRLRREAVEGSVKVFPLQSPGVIYGAIISGEHVFYIIEKGAERLDGLAKFTHVWLLKDNSWKMARILSYDHGPATFINKRKEIKLSPAALDQLTGTYKGPQSGNMLISRENSWLTLQINNNKFDLYPETPNHFFIKDRNLTFEFITNEKGKVSKMIVRENGVIAEEAIPLK